MKSPYRWYIYGRLIFKIKEWLSLELLKCLFIRKVLLCIVLWESLFEETKWESFPKHGKILNEMDQLLSQSILMNIFVDQINIVICRFLWEFFSFLAFYLCVKLYIFLFLSLSPIHIRYSCLFLYLLIVYCIIFLIYVHVL